MIIEFDLQASIEELANEGDPSAVVSRLLERATAQPIRRQLRLVLPLAAAAVVAALAVGAAFVVSDRSSNRHTGAVPSATTAAPCTTSTTPSFTTFSVGPVPDLTDTITVATTCAGYRVRWYYTTSGGVLGVITLYQPGVFDPATTRTGRRVNGSGISGYYADQLPDAALGRTCTAQRPTFACGPGIAWQYAPGAWATINSGSLHNPGGFAKAFFGTDPIAKLLTVAAAVRPDDHQALRSPFRLGTLAGTLPLTAGTSTTSLHGNDVGQAAANLELAVPGSGRHCPQNAACTAAVTINVNSTVDPPGSSLGGFSGRRVQIGSSTGLLITGTTRGPGPQRQLRFQSGHWVAIIQVTNPDAGITDNQLLTLARGMTFAPSTTDSATWYPFNQAVPH